MYIIDYIFNILATLLMIFYTNIFHFNQFRSRQNVLNSKNLRLKNLSFLLLCGKVLRERLNRKVTILGTFRNFNLVYGIIITEK